MECFVYSNATNQCAIALRDIPRIKDDEVLVAVLYAGICRTDIEICKGYVPGYEGPLGHEFVGSIENCETASKRLVCVDINIPCEACHVCQSEDLIIKRNHCPKRKCIGIHHCDGAFANYIAVPKKNVFFVPPRVEAKCAVFAEPLAAILRLFEQGLFDKLPFNARIAIVGDGRIGFLSLITIQFWISVSQLIITRNQSTNIHGEAFYAKDWSPKVVLLGHYPERDLLKEFDMEFYDAKCFRSTLQGGKGVGSGVGKLRCSRAEDNEKLFGSFDLVIEASGNPFGFLLAVKLARSACTIAMKTTIASQTGTDQSEAFNEIVVRELQIKGSRCGSVKDALALLGSDNIPNYFCLYKTPVQSADFAQLQKLQRKFMSQIMKLISAEFKLNEAQDAFHKCTERGVLKVILNCQK